MALTPQEVELLAEVFDVSLSDLEGRIAEAGINCLALGEWQAKITATRFLFAKITGQAKGRAVFQRPTVAEVAAYCQERKNTVDAQVFCDFYESKGWLVGRQAMKDWRAAVRTWERNRQERNGIHGQVKTKSRGLFRPSADSEQ